MKSFKNFPRKVIYSKNKKCWSSHIFGYNIKRFVAEYKPIIEYIENKKDQKSDEFKVKIKEMENIVAQEFKVYISLGDCDNLEVKEVKKPYKITYSHMIEGEYVDELSDLWIF